MFNPAGTQTLAAQTLVEGWSRELTEHADAARTGGASLPLVMALAEQALAEPALAEPGFPTLHGGGGWQLRLIVMDDDDEHITVLYESGRLPPFVTRVAK